MHNNRDNGCSSDVTNELKNVMKNTKVIKYITIVNSDERNQRIKELTASSS